MLTDKAKENFEKWFITKIRKRSDIGDRYFDSALLDGLYSADFTIQGAYAQEWFRECGLHISVYPHGDGINWCFGLSRWKNEPMQNVFDRLSYRIFKENEKLLVNDHTECFQMAVKKANEIYNTTHK